MLLIGLAACKPAQHHDASQVIGLSTSFALIWSEAGDIRGQLATPAPRHWAVTMMAEQGRVVPIDTLADASGKVPLPEKALLVLAQPQPLSPQENVSLDAWVRGGGRLLLFVDPMLTAHSDLPLGDPRGPQRVAMLSPLLLHWGLRMEFDPAQFDGDRIVLVQGMEMPVNLAGRFAAVSSGPCRIEAEALVADCRIGEGHVLAIGDAAVFDGDDAGRSAAFAALLARISR